MLPLLFLLLVLALPATAALGVAALYAVYLHAEEIDGRED